MDAIVAIGREFGWNIAGVVAVVAMLAITVRVLATRLEKAYDAQLKAITDGHEKQVRAITDGHGREIEALREHGAKGWDEADKWERQAQRLADQYGNATELAREMVDEALDKRRRRPSPPVR